MITDHALLRYAEATQESFCVRKAKNQMLTAELKAAIKAGAKRFKQDGLEYRIENGKVVTVIGGFRKSRRR